jgi:hypothetical protein
MSDDHEISAKRRKVRKGTRSCWSCKRRKVRCVFRSDSDAVCFTCTRRGTNCVSQIFYDDEQCSQLLTPESLTSNGHHELIAAKRPFVDAYPPTRGLESTARLQNERSAVTTPPADRLPPLPEIRITPGSVDARSKTTRALIDSMPPAQDLDKILHRLSQIRLSYYSERVEAERPRRKGLSITSAGLRNPDAGPVTLARQMLLLAIGIQHCHQSLAGSHLSQPPELVASSLARAAIQHVTTNESLLTSLESMDCILLESSFYGNKGDMQKAWIAMRRAITTGQLLRMHEGPRKSLNTHHDLDASVVWSCAQDVERITSLLIGLPTSIPYGHIAEGVGLDIVVKALPAKIVQRNELTDEKLAMDLTNELNEYMLRVGEELAIMTELRQKSRHDPDIGLMFHNICYQAMVVQLHLPYVLFASDEIQRNYSTVASVSACRDLLSRHTALKRLESIHPCCSLADFMACMAALALLSVHLIGRSVANSRNMLALQRASDKLLIEHALGAMSRPAYESDGSLVAQCITAIRSLLRLVSVNTGHAVSVHKFSEPNTPNSDHTLIEIEIQGAGTVKISRRGLSGDAAEQQALTIGGFGTLQILPNAPSVTAEETFPVGQSTTIDMLAPALETWDALNNDWFFDGVFDASTFFDAFAGTGHEDNVQPRTNVVNQW